MKPLANAQGSAGATACGPAEPAPAAHEAPAREPRAAPPAASSARVGAPAPQRLDTAQLLQGQNEVLIDHGSTVYRLRKTALGKLILTK